MSTYGRCTTVLSCWLSAPAPPSRQAPEQGLPASTHLVQRFSALTTACEGSPSSRLHRSGCPGSGWQRLRV
eukprot:2148902-Pyramimonas_sp.AAC.1